MDAEWAKIFAVCVQACIKGSTLAVLPVPFQCNSGIARRLPHATLLRGHVQVCGGNAGDLLTAIQPCTRIGHGVGGDVCCELRQAKMSYGRLESTPCHATALRVIWRTPRMRWCLPSRKAFRGGQSSIAPCCSSSANLTMQQSLFHVHTWSWTQAASRLCRPW